MLDLKMSLRKRKNQEEEAYGATLTLGLEGLMRCNSPTRFTINLSVNYRVGMDALMAAVL